MTKQTYTIYSYNTRKKAYVCAASDEDAIGLALDEHWPAMVTGRPERVSVIVWVGGSPEAGRTHSVFLRWSPTVTQTVRCYAL